MICKTVGVTAAVESVTINKPITDGIYDNTMPLEVDIDFGTDDLVGSSVYCPSRTGYCGEIQLLTEIGAVVWSGFASSRYYTGTIDVSGLSGNYKLRAMLYSCPSYSVVQRVEVNFKLAGAIIIVADVYIKDSLTGQEITQATTNQNVDIGVYLANNGDVSGSVTAQITINGIELTAVTKTIDGHQSWIGTVWSGTLTVGTHDICAEIV